MPNLLQHVENIQTVFGLPCVVAINAFPTDTSAELTLVEEKCRALNVPVALSEVWAKGGEGGVALAEAVCRIVITSYSIHYTKLYEAARQSQDRSAASSASLLRG